MTVGESVVVEVRLTNGGDQRDRERVTLRVDGDLVASKGLRLDAGESDVLTFERSFDDLGDHELTVEDTELPTVTVVESGTTERSPTARNQTAIAPASGEHAPRSERVDVVDASGLADWVRTGYNASVEATLVNRGDREAVHTLSVAVDGRPVANETVRVPPEARTNVSVEFPAVGGEVTVNGAEAGTLVVGDSWNTPAAAAEPEPTSSQGPGFGFGAVAAALVVCALAARAARSKGNGE